MSDENVEIVEQEEPIVAQEEPIVNIIFNDEEQFDVVVDDMEMYSAESLVPLFEAQATAEIDIRFLATYKYNLDACVRGDLRVLKDLVSVSTLTESIEAGDSIGFASVHKNGL
jgi:hypothetical protein